MKISKVENDNQDRTSNAWKKLCDYIEELVESGSEEFSPRDKMGDLFLDIHTLPESIAKLKRVKKVWLYGSNIKRIPPEIGEMESLEQFDPYTSYGLHWFPYEIINCKKLKSSRISTRALYGNYKNRMGFPSLKSNPIRYHHKTVNCSICKKTMSYELTDQYWVSMSIGTDVVPLLTNVCSEVCKTSIASPSNDYIQFPHKGGSELKQPLTKDERWKLEKKQNEVDVSKNIHVSANVEEDKRKKFQLLKPTYKLWEK
jgi:hypothetical protein